jgi:hypothetical protein
MTRWALLLTSSLAAVASGCVSASSAPILSGSMTGSAATIEGGDVAILREAARDVLRRSRFVLNQDSARSGLITTFPTGSQHFFEFWRHDVATAADFWEATFNKIRRRARVMIVTDTDEPKIKVVVRKERFSAPQRQFNDSVSVLRLFQRAAVSDRRQATTDQASEWIDMGRDPALESRLLSEIVTEARRLGWKGTIRSGDPADVTSSADGHG